MTHTGEEKQMNDAIILREKKYNRNKIEDMIEYIFDDYIDDKITNYDEIFIKPNLMYYWDSSTGETTDPLLISLIIKKIFDVCGKDVNIKIIESDASAMRTKYSFKILGYEKLVSKKVDLINLSQGEQSIN